MFGIEKKNIPIALTRDWLRFMCLRLRGNDLASHDPLVAASLRDAITRTALVVQC